MAVRAASAQDRELGAGGELLEGVAAVVDEGLVLKSELAERLDLVLKNLEQQQAELPPEQRRPLPPVVRHRAASARPAHPARDPAPARDRVGITVSDDLLNEALSRVAQNLGYTLEELPAVLAAQNINYATYREDSRRISSIEQLEQRDVISPHRDHAARARAVPRSTADASASDAFDYNISHILIGVPANATQQDIETARARIDEIHDRLEAGEDFARLAVATSHAQTALEGGSLGWRKGAQLPTLFADLVDPHEARRVLGARSKAAAASRSSGSTRCAAPSARWSTSSTCATSCCGRTRSSTTRPCSRSRSAFARRSSGGDDFATVAQAVSEDTASAADGGDLGWLSPGDTVPEFEQALAQLPLNELSEPIKSRFGWHLVEVLERRSHDTTDEVKREQCARQIRAAKAEEERELWLRRLRDQAFVDIRR